MRRVTPPLMERIEPSWIVANSRLVIDQGLAPLSLSRKNPGTSLCRAPFSSSIPTLFFISLFKLSIYPSFFPSISQPLEPQLQISQTLELIISSHLISFNLNLFTTSNIKIFFNRSFQVAEELQDIDEYSGHEGTYCKRLSS
ncbi:unnamed protein product [Citrullus colocynthis]|uniref:Uncharacterized protein n=1 Tax=Citrullus colocynthis TaxID=252529 RepID=A0ABP0YT02_9ROSI